MADKILVVDDSLTDLTEKRSTSQDLKTKYVSPSDLVNLGNGGYTYTEVAVSIPEILAVGSSPKQILASPGANSYYEYHGFIEYSAGATAYTFTNDGFVIGDNDTYSGDYIALNLVNTTVNHAVGFSSYPKGQEVGAGGGYNVGYPTKTNRPLELFTFNGTNPTLGDGTLLVKIWYKVKTFGTEL